MNQKKSEFAVGIFVLVGIAAILYLAIQIGSNQVLGGATFQLKARFNNIGGLTTGSNVMIAGVKVGKVGEITLNEQHVAIIGLNLKKDYGLYDDTIASIKTNGLIGDKFVSLSPGFSEIPLEEGELIVDTESALDIESLISRFAFGSIEEEEKK